MESQKNSKQQCKTLLIALGQKNQNDNEIGNYLQELLNSSQFLLTLTQNQVNRVIFQNQNDILLKSPQNNGFEDMSFINIQNKFDTSHQLENQDLVIATLPMTLLLLSIPNFNIQIITIGDLNSQLQQKLKQTLVQKQNIEFLDSIKQLNEDIINQQLKKIGQQQSQLQNDSDKINLQILNYPLSLDQNQNSQNANQLLSKLNQKLQQQQQDDNEKFDLFQNNGCQNLKLSEEIEKQKQEIIKIRNQNHLYPLQFPISGEQTVFQKDDEQNYIQNEDQNQDLIDSEECLVEIKDKKSYEQQILKYQQAANRDYEEQKHKMQQQNPQDMQSAHYCYQTQFKKQRPVIFDLAQIDQDQLIKKQPELNQQNEKEKGSNLNVSKTVHRVSKYYKLLRQQQKVIYGTNYEKIRFTELLNEYPNKKMQIIQQFLSKKQERQYLKVENITQLERLEVVKLVQELYRQKILEQNFLVCDCIYCKRLLLPFLLRNDFLKQPQETQGQIYNLHKIYYFKIAKQLGYQDESEFNILHNLLFRKIPINLLCIASTNKK